MIKKASLATLLTLSMLAGFAQVDSTERKTNHYLGVQANQLIRQILNFSNSSVATNNPYLLIYSMNSASSGHGLNLGVGYFINEVNDGDLFNKRETSINNLSLRIGWERKASLGRRWLASYGFDVTILSNKNETVNSTEVELNKSKITTNNTTSGVGGGPRLTLNYMLGDRLLLGTEVNYYYSRLKNKSDIKSAVTTQQFDPFTGTVRPMTVVTSEDSEDKTKRFELSAPVAIFLILKISK